MSLAKFGKFLVIIIYSSPTLSRTWMLHICYSPTGPFGCVLFFFSSRLFSLCYPDLVISIFLSSSLLKHFSVFSILPLSPSTEFFISALVFLYIFNFLLNFFSKYVHKCSLKHFYHSCFKNLCQIIITSRSSWCWYLLIVFSHSSWDFPGSW